VSAHLPSELGDLLVDGIEPTPELLLDLGELSSEEFDELLVFLRGHASSLSHPHRAFKCIHCDTIPPTLLLGLDIPNRAA